MYCLYTFYIRFIYFLYFYTFYTFLCSNGWPGQRIFWVQEFAGEVININIYKYQVNVIRYNFKKF